MFGGLCGFRRRGAITELQVRTFLKQKLPDYIVLAIYVFLDYCLLHPTEKWIAELFRLQSNQTHLAPSM